MLLQSKCICIRFYCIVKYCIVSSYFSLFFVFYLSAFSAYVANKRLHKDVLFVCEYYLSDAPGQQKQHANLNKITVTGNR